MQKQTLLEFVECLKGPSDQPYPLQIVQKMTPVWENSHRLASQRPPFMSTNVDHKL